jgi:uncharacterized membrane protein YciS (DUF1049 family)
VPSGSFVISTLTNGGFVGGGVDGFLAFAAFWAKSGELRTRRLRRKARRMVREREITVVIACSDVDLVPEV